MHVERNKFRSTTPSERAMTFRLFIYYCAVCGGWAALLAWAVTEGLGVPQIRSLWLRTAATSGLVGLLLAGAVGTVDAILNAMGRERLLRILVCVGVGFFGGILGGILGELLHSLRLFRFLGWMVVGMMIGASIGVFDVFGARSGRDLSVAGRKLTNGLIGGVLGGLGGGLIVELLKIDWVQQMLRLPRSAVALGLVILGVSIGLLIGLAQVILKEAWVRIEKGFRAGREMMLARADTTIGRAESCDIGLFGDPAVERIHARIVRQGNRFVLADAGSAGGTFLNDQRVTQTMPLRSGDLIRVGSSVLRFGERTSRQTSG
jgi:hypothetical protein